MNTIVDKELLKQCKRRIADKLQLGGDSGKLRSRDFEYLASSIEERSGIRLSISTLKRIWKKGYDKTPHPATLNALVAVLGYEDWQAFRKEASGESADPGSPVRLYRNLTPFLLPLILVSLLIVLVFHRDSGGIFADLMQIPHPVKIRGAVTFSANKMEAVGVPNTVIFNYDVSCVEADSFFIQQSWNPRNKVRIDPEKNHFSSIYYNPGFHFARLIANDSVLKLQPVHIQTEDWLAMAKYDRRDPEPIYLPNDSVVKSGALKADKLTLQAAGVDIERDFYVRYYQVRDFGGITFDNFNLSTKIRIDSIRNTVCPYLEIMVVTEGDVSYLQFTPKGCVANLALLIGEQYRSASEADLSAFGTDVYRWQEVAWKVKDRQAEIILNGEPAYRLDFRESFGKIVGVILTFRGAGEVEYFKINPSEMMSDLGN